VSDNGDHVTPGRQTKLGPAIDFKGMSAVQLRELIAEAQGELIAKQEAAKTDLLAKWHAEAEEAGLTLDAVTATHAPKAKDRSPTGSKAAVKYRGPNGEEWSGRGRLPKWVQVAEAEGKSREDFKA